MGDPFLLDGVTSDENLLAARLASRAEDQDAIDMAALASPHSTDNTFKLLHFKPFDPVHKRTEATVHAENGREFSISKGAPQVIRERWSNIVGRQPSLIDQ